MKKNENVPFKNAIGEMYQRTKNQIDGRNLKLPSDAERVYKSNDMIPRVFEPKLRNRWKFSLPITFNIPQWAIASTTLPNYPFDNGTITVTLHDPIEPSTSKSLFMLLVNNIKKFKIKIDILDPTGVVIEKWILSGCKIISVNWGLLDYAIDDIHKITAVIKYKKVKLK